MFYGSIDNSLGKKRKPHGKLSAKGDLREKEMFDVISLSVAIIEALPYYCNFTFTLNSEHSIMCHESTREPLQTHTWSNQSNI